MISLGTRKSKKRMPHWWSFWKPTKLRYCLCELIVVKLTKYMSILALKKISGFLIFLQQYLLDILREKKKSEKHTTYMCGRSKARDALKNPGFGPIADEDQVSQRSHCADSFDMYSCMYSLCISLFNRNSARSLYILPIVVIFCIYMYSVPTLYMWTFFTVFLYLILTWN